MNPSTISCTKSTVTLKDHVVDIISDSGEGAQKCAVSFATIAAKMGNGIWTVEIIPAEIQPPARSIAGASGNRIRVGSYEVANGGDEADMVVAFNEQVLLGRLNARELKPGCTILMENKWRSHTDEAIAASYARVADRLNTEGYNLVEIPMEEECLKIVANPQKGKNMFALGLLVSVYSFDMDLAREQIALIFKKKGDKVIQPNIRLLEAGYQWAEENLDFKYQIPSSGVDDVQIVVNGNTAVGLGVLAAGMEICAMYPITPATSASHYLSDVIEQIGGVVHQAEDEIAAVNFAIGASYAGKCAVTITSGPGYSLKQEAIGLAVMGEIPLVVVNVQRGGPSTGQPTKVEQGDLLTSVFGSHGDAPKVVMAPASIEECFYAMITARRIAETYNMVVVVLTDANLATAQAPFRRPRFQKSWMASSVNQGPVPEGAKPYDWDPTTGLIQRFIPGQPNGMHTLTGLAHDRSSRVAYDPDINQEGIQHRSLKLAAFQKSLQPPTLYGDPDGDLLVVGWGSTRGAIREAVDRVREDGHRVGMMHLRFLNPLPPGIGELLKRFDRVMTVEINWCDDPQSELIDHENRRYSNLAWILRGRYLVDVDCWCEVKGQPIKPGAIERMLRQKLQAR